MRDPATVDALQRIAHTGSDMTKPLDMDFFIAVPSQDTGNLVAEEVTPNGFVTKVELDSESQEWTCYCTKTIIPEYNTVNVIELELHEIAIKYGGYIDGFGTYGNTPNENP